MTLLVLMAGPTDPFRDVGFPYPKNLVEINGVPLVQHALENLKPLRENCQKLVCIMQADEQRQFHTAEVVRLIHPEALVIELTGATSGAACSALLAVEHIKNDDELIITNGDHVIDTDFLAVIDQFRRADLDAGTIVFESVHPRWSFVRLDQQGFVIEAAEKRPISKHATAGFYYYRKGSDFVDAASRMITKDAQVGGKFYVCPTLNELILLQKRIGVARIEPGQYHSLASPQSVELYVSGLNKKEAQA